MAFILGPFWYLSKGMTSKGLCLLVICMITFLTTIPFIWVYCGIKGQNDWYEYQLKTRGKYSLDRL